MGKIKKYMIILICLITIISILLIITLNSNKKKTGEYLPEEFEKGSENTNDVNKTYSRISSNSDYFRVKEIIQRYYKNVNKVNGQKEEIIEYEVEGENQTGSLDTSGDKQKSKNILYNMLDDQYIKEQNISVENIENVLEKSIIEDFIIDEIYTVENSINVITYYVYGKTFTNSNISNFAMIVVIDNKNQTFSLFLNDYIIKNQIDKYEVGKIIENEIEAIKDKEYNKTIYKNIEDGEIIINYYNDYKKLLKYSNNLLYSKINQEYKNAKFSQFNQFVQYISNNKLKLQNRNIVKYSKEKYDNYTQYACLDQSGGYIIFNVTSPTQYNIILDTYTINLPEFTEKYETATSQEKVLLNIQKCFEAINNKDYEYVYSKLDETFKTNNFGTIQNFENYIKSHLFEINKISATNGKTQGNLYTYDLEIKDSLGTNTNIIKKTFVMQLKDKADFVMSFEI